MNNISALNNYNFSPLCTFWNMSKKYLCAYDLTHIEKYRSIPDLLLNSKIPYDCEVFYGNTFQKYNFK